ncbi:MAG: phospholipid/cholesterol/gamma-HCH transport system substrate-binding protein [Solirubrobacterales bacterium]|jgi:ABC-type transporter Mla subunit MlaD|nr:phospholipid/cholesterol/gamma-HCH transport system substrate-binding protein [Solirubrobacterales bacterium]MDX6662918.1 phospholipid/cholesterol/gamma-HCH transport system substrate-binding protein [Solirubrobacterales bacterium]
MRANEGHRFSNTAIGFVAIVLVFVLFYLAFTKSLPWSGGYEVKAVVKNAQNLALKSPVRVAGIEIGKVSGIDPVNGANDDPSQGAVVTMRINGNGRPIHTDAKIKLRPRLFLEGNLFVDLQPGSPSAPEADSGFTIPVQHTSNSVQLDQVLTNALQADPRQDLQRLLKELGDAFVKYGGAEGFRTFFATSAVANRATAEVNQAVLGTSPDDLSNLVVNLDRTVAGLGDDEAKLKGLVTSLSKVTGAFAAESKGLEVAIGALPGVLINGRSALANLNTAFPPLRAFARDALPGARTAGPALDAANPWIAQLRGLLSKPEARGLAADLRPTIPQLARLASESRPFLEQIRPLSNCFDKVIVPWGNMSVGSHADTTVGPIYKETGYGLVGLAGESRSGDANGQYIRVEAGGGANTVVFGAGADKTVGVTPFSLLGYEPAVGSSGQDNVAASGGSPTLKTPFRPDVPCETQEPPNLDSGGVLPFAAGGGTQTMSAQRSPSSIVSSALRAQILAKARQVQSLVTKKQKVGSARGRKGRRARGVNHQLMGAWRQFLSAGRALGGGS